MKMAGMKMGGMKMHDLTKSAAKMRGMKMSGMKTPAGINPGKWMVVVHHLLGDSSCKIAGQRKQPCWCTYLRADRGRTATSWTAAAEKICKEDLGCWHDIGHAAFVADLRPLTGSSELLAIQLSPILLHRLKRKATKSGAAAPQCLSAMTSLLRSDEAYTNNHFHAAEKICSAASTHMGAFSCAAGLYHAAMSGTGPYRAAMAARPAKLELCDASSLPAPCYYMAALNSHTKAHQLGHWHRLSAAAMACDSRKHSEVCWWMAMLADSSIVAEKCRSPKTKTWKARCDRANLLRAFTLEKGMFPGAKPRHQIAKACAKIKAVGNVNPAVMSFCVAPRIEWFSA